jgi:hypothetical protein
MKLMSIILAVIVSSLIGWIVYVASASDTAAYIVGVISMALGVVAIVLTLYTPVGEGIRSKIRGTNIKGSIVTGTKSPEGVPGSINSDIKLRNVGESMITGNDVSFRPPTQPGPR